MGKIKKLNILLSCLFIFVLVACGKKEVKEVETAYEVADTLYQEELDKESEITTENEEEEVYPKLSIIIDDFGNYNNFMLDSLLVKFGQLPPQVAFAILPNLPYSEFVMEFFQDTGRELLLHTPMQPLNEKINAGQEVIQTDDDAITIINKLNSMYGQLDKIVGLNNHMGSKATADKEVMTTVLEWCKENNLFFVDSATIGNSLAYDLALELGIPSAKRNIFLDVPDASIETVEHYLTKLSKYSQEGKDILVITHASTLQRQTSLNYFIQQASLMGYKLVPVSEFLTYPIQEEIQAVSKNKANKISNTPL